MEVIADKSGIYCGNGKVFETKEEAILYAKDLSSRWMLVKCWRVLENDGKSDERVVATGDA
jgi:hypothetical protein